MTEHNALCSDERLISLLHLDEDSGELRDWAEHVDHCPHCRFRLEQLAAEPREWDIAKESLRGGENEDETGEAGIDGQPWLGNHHRNSGAWTESMARQLLSPPSHPEMLGRIGRYDVERLIGSGGMGVVFKAFDTELNRPVAVKVLAPYLAGSGAARQRFAREARAAAAVVHEHVVAIHNVESDGQAPFLVMPFVAGESLQQRIDREGALELCEILRISMQTAAGLAAAHAQGLVHRDVKPSNILLEQGVERALLTDFGLARTSHDANLTLTGYHPGTPQYMSPEQAHGEAVDAHSDLFSLGSVIYAMCTARPPFEAETSYGILRRITDNEPRSIRDLNPAIPDWLERIVQRLLAKPPAGRFQSAVGVSDLLEQCLAHVQHPTAVRLPTQCRANSRRALNGLIQLTPMRAIWDKWNNYSTFARTAFLLSGMVLASLMIAGGLQFFDTSDLPNQPVAGEGLERAEVLPISSAESDPATAWEATSTEIDSYGNDFQPFETRSQQLWDYDPIHQE